jgi:hypothetical protein
MKKSVIAVFALGLMLLASGASAVNTIGLFGDVDATQCSGNVPLYAPYPVHVVAVLDMISADGMTAAEFLVDGIDNNPAMVSIAITYASPLTIGEILGNEGFSIAFVECQPGPIVVLGELSFLAFNPAWPGNDAVWCVVPTVESMKLVVVDCEFIEIPADGWCFVANCTEGDCDCSVAAEETSWGAVKALY